MAKSKADPKIYPCGLDGSDKDRVKRRPIKCNLHDCFGCAFNPAEKERRLKYGVFKTKAIRHTIRYENGKPDETRDMVVRVLHFRKAGI